MSNTVTLQTADLPCVEVEIDARVIIPCPEVGFENRRASVACTKCEYFKGVFRLSYEGEWHQQYCIKCSRPISRRVQLEQIVIEK